MGLRGAAMLVGGIEMLLGPVFKHKPRCLGALAKPALSNIRAQAKIGQSRSSVARIVYGCNRDSVRRISCSATAKEVSPNQSMATQMTVVEHVVLFKVKDDVPEEKFEEVMKALRGLKDMDVVIDLSAGKVLQILGGNYTHALHSRYHNRDDLAVYSKDPTHLAIVKNLLPLVDDLLAADWECQPVGTPIDGGHGAARIALIKLADSITDIESTEVFTLLSGLKEKFPFIRQVSSGTNFSPGRAQGINVGFLALFNNIEELEQLNGNSELHSILQKSKVAPVLDKFIIVDIGTK